MVDVSPEARRLFERDTQALLRESLGLLVRLVTETTGRRSGRTSAEARSLMRRFLHAVHSLKGLLAMLPETLPLAESLQSLEARLGLQSPEVLLAELASWAPQAKDALVRVGGSLGWKGGPKDSGGAVPSVVSPAAASGTLLRGADRDGGESGEEDSGWVVHLEEKGMPKTLWVAAACVDFWIDLPARQAARDVEVGWSILGDDWIRVLGSVRKADEGALGHQVRALTFRLMDARSVASRGTPLLVLVYTDSVEWLVSRSRARLQGLEKLDDWVRRRLSSLKSKGSITSKEESVETHFDVGIADRSRITAA